MQLAPVGRYLSNGLRNARLLLICLLHIHCSKLRDFIKLCAEEFSDASIAFWTTLSLT